MADLLMNSKKVDTSLNSAAKIRAEVKESLSSTTLPVDLSPVKIYNAQALHNSTFEDQIPPPLNFDFDDAVNVVNLAMMAIEQFGLILVQVHSETRHEQRNKIKEEFNIQVKGIEAKFRKDLEVARTQYKMGTIDIATGKKMMDLAAIQFNLQIAAATAKLAGAVIGAFIPFAGATGTFGSSVLEAGAGFVGVSINVLSVVNQGQQSMLSATVTKLTAEATAIEHAYQAHANMVSSERGLTEDFGRTIRSIFDSVISTLAAMADKQNRELSV